ncbi:DUF2269 family protein [Rhabdothermincola sp.]|uniref:DUF2269 family protein n=1 Tax=Rhabdothermincola sp. TaxID=2820405 RepID=UPI002FE3DF63
MGTGSFAYQLFFLLHLLAVIVGFGSSFVWPVLAAKARQQEPPVAYAMSNAGFQAAKVLTTPFIWAAGAFGVVLIVLSDEAWKFSDTWISIAFLLFFAAALFSLFVHVPNLRAMLALQEKLVSGQVTPGPGGPPAEVAELQARGKRAGMYTGILHLLFLLLMIDMIWKPGT